MSQHPHTLKLYRGDVLLGILSNIHLYDWPWYQCDFQAMPEFELYRPLFEKELEIDHHADDADDQWNLAYEKIVDLKLTLVDLLDSQATELFILHIKGEQADFRIAFPQ